MRHDKSAPSATPAPERRSARERLLAAANELFYDGGIHTVGIDRVIEKAGVAKASLYDCFGSKEALIQGYLEDRQAARRRRIEAALARHDTPRAQLLGLFDAVTAWVAEPGFRGCPFVRVAAEVPADSPTRATCDAARGWLRSLLTGLARDAGAADPEALGCRLMLLYDGATVAATADGLPQAARQARDTAALLLDAALGPARAQLEGIPQA